MDHIKDRKHQNLSQG